MKRILIILVCLMVGLSSCSHKQTFIEGDKKIEAKPYGLFNMEANKNDSVVYQVNFANVAIGVILCETIIVPIYIAGWDLWEPVRLKDKIIIPRR